MFDDDPQYQKLKEIRESGYDGPLDQDYNPVPSDNLRAQILDAPRRTGA